MKIWYGFVGGEVIGPFETADPWYHEHAGPDWRAREYERTGVDPWLVDRTELATGQIVSTVFLGLDHSLTWRAGGPPQVFETTVLGDWDPMWRCSTLAEARAYHARMCAYVTLTAVEAALDDREGGLTTEC